MAAAGGRWTKRGKFVAKGKNRPARAKKKNNEKPPKDGKRRPKTQSEFERDVLEVARMKKDKYIWGNANKAYISEVAKEFDMPLEQFKSRIIQGWSNNKIGLARLDLRQSATGRESRVADASATSMGSSGTLAHFIRTD